MCLLKIPSTTCRILLSHFKWDKEKLMEWFVFFIKIYMNFIV